jgi:hypothetical protein
MRGVLAAIAVLLLLLTGCTAAQPPRPVGEDFAAILAERADAVWQLTSLSDSSRPAVQLGQAHDQFTAASLFSSCMASRGWPHYFARVNGYGYRAVQLAETAEERIDWYECFAAYPVDSEYTMQSAAQFDLVYDYFKDTLIPCLHAQGYSVTDAPSRLQFRTTWDGWGDPLFPFVWNPYYDLERIATDPEALQRQCPPTPPSQSFYVFAG